MEASEIDPNDWLGVRQTHLITVSRNIELLYVHDHSGIKISRE